MIDAIIHEIMIMSGFVNVRHNPAISPTNDTIASCMPSIIDDLGLKLFVIVNILQLLINLYNICFFS